jgi:type VI secretion system secreted protein Hcp
MSIADMFLKVAGVTGESSDADMKGQIDVVSWSWGMESPIDSFTGAPAGRTRVGEIHVTKRVDKASTTLMTFQGNNKEVDSASLIVRKAGKTPLTYFQIDMQYVRITSLQISSEGSELTERLVLRARHLTFTYTPQSALGAVGGGSTSWDWTWDATR